MKRRGITIIEIITVMVILIVLGALLMPTLAKAKMAAKVSASKQNLKGMWQGLLIYQQDYDDRVQYGPVIEMGLPFAGKGFSNFLRSYTGIASTSWADHQAFTPCGIRVRSEPYVGILYFGNGIDDWPKDVKQYEGNTVVLADKNCNTSDVRIECQYCDKRSIGITLLGEIRDRHSSEYQFWQQNFYL